MPRKWSKILLKRFRLHQNWINNNKIMAEIDTEDPSDTAHAYSPKRLFWLCLGCICVALGTLGVFLPLLPTTSFMLVAAYSFARSSKRLHHWLLTHKVFGPLINDWQTHRAISTRAKIMSVLSMVAVVGISAIFQAPYFVIVIQIVVLSCVAIFLLSRPKPPKLLS